MVQKDLKMESNGNAAGPASATGFRRHHHGKPPSSVRLLTIPPTSFSRPTNSHENELSEHDIFCSSPDFSSSASSSTLPTPTSTIATSQPPSHNQQGILAALPLQSESEMRSVFNHKASSVSVSPVSTTSTASLPSPSSSARIFIPKRPPQPHKLFQQSAPVNVPMLSEAMRRSREARLFDDVIEDNDDEDGYRADLMPPHMIVASKPAPMLACSVLEGAGRTLKGRDLRQVRNAVLRKTGFID